MKTPQRYCGFKCNLARSSPPGFWKNLHLSGSIFPKNLADYTATLCYTLSFAFIPSILSSKDEYLKHTDKYQSYRLFYEWGKNPKMVYIELEFLKNFPSQVLLHPLLHKVNPAHKKNFITHTSNWLTLLPPPHCFGKYFIHHNPKPPTTKSNHISILLIYK